MSERRNKIVQWMLNQGSGIVDAPETCFLKETTEKEQAEHPFGSVRTTSRIGGAEKRRIAFIMTTVVAAGLLMAGMIAIAVLMVLILTPSKTPKK